ncbi:glycoside hydrolase family 3 C-terminal domain-containing protein [Lachnospiraceae bacterium 29-91]
MIQKSSRLWRATTSLFALFFGVSATANVLTSAYESKVHAYFGTNSTKYVTEDAGEDTEYYKTEYKTWTEQYTHAQELIEDIQEEGSVLLENNGALPLESGEKVSLFSRSSVDIVYGGTGSGSIDEAALIPLKSEMEEAGFSVNDILWDFYSEQEGYERTTTDIAEVPISEYTDEVISSYKNYNDAAIVVISRTGGEGNDPDASAEYLELKDEEKDLLKHVNEYFDKIIVLANSNNALSLNWLEEYNVDACLWIGGPGQEGLGAVAEILNGTRNPSGKLADTYASSSLSSPAMQNFGEFIYTNSAMGENSMDSRLDVFTNSQGKEVTVGNAAAYVIYAEGIYVGYRYYETRYEDTVLKQGNADGEAGIFNSTGNTWNYSEEVDYPFGYGLSYTKFSQSLDDVKIDGDTITVTATVTNTGDTYSGKDVVEVYFQAPYVKGEMEKASVELCGFEKTDVLEPGESQTLEVTINKKDLASYDYAEVKTYALDEGTYYFAIGDNAHDALNNILAEKGKTVADGMDYEGDKSKTDTVEFGAELYDSDDISGNEITNLFDDADLNYYAEGAVTYLSRSDWNGTWPQTYESIEATDEMIEALQNDYTPAESNEESITYNADNGLNIMDIYGLEYDDETWDKLLDQMSLEEQVEMVQNGASQTAAAESIAFSGTVDADGPAGLGSITGRRYYYEDPKDESTITTTSAIGYNSSVVIASTWNKDLIHERGVSIGEDGLWTNTEGWWGPGANTHRTPYSGRNFEYYSEDPYLGGISCANDVAGAQSKGMRAFVKHFAVNDQEKDRHGLGTFTNEQALREIYLEQFRHVVQEGGTLSLMGAFNRVGCTWAGAEDDLNNGLLREEWGAQASVLTDFNSHSSEGWMNVRSGLAGGTNQWLAIGESNLIKYAEENKDVAYEVRESCHRILYAIAKSAAVNGINETTRVVSVTAWWQTVLYVAMAVTGILALVSFGIVTMDTISKVKSRKKESK